MNMESGEVLMIFTPGFQIFATGQPHLARVMAIRLPSCDDTCACYLRAHDLRSGMFRSSSQIISLENQYLGFEARPLYAGGCAKLARAIEFMLNAPQ